MKRIYFLILLIGQVVLLKAEAMNVYGVVLAGGVGERLWPLSRQGHPKQFLTVGSEHTLLEQAVNRLRGVSNNLWVVTSGTHAASIDEALQKDLSRVLVEPSGRNTGPAILYACQEIVKQDPDAIVVFVPADPYIPERDTELYRTYLSRAVSYATEHDVIVLCGVKPTYPATGYGYIEHAFDSCGMNIYPVSRFHEKPTYVLAQQYINQKNMLWNIGTFIGKASLFIDEFQRVAPDLFGEVDNYLSGDTPYHTITPISVDCAVIEKSNRVVVLPVDFSWCDVGNVDVFLSIKDQCSPVKSQVVTVDAHNNLVEVPNKLVALVGVDDLCVVETSDALLITKRSEAEKVRSVVQKLKQENKTEYL